MIRQIFTAVSRIDSVRSRIDSAKKMFEQVTGIEQLKAEAAAAVSNLHAATEHAKHPSSKGTLLTEKAAATSRGEPWVAVLDTKFNPENPRNGFFELDWNPMFVNQLIHAGYGTESDPEEEIVDRWFRDLAYQMLVESEQDPSRGSGLVTPPNR